MTTRLIFFLVLILNTLAVKVAILIYRHTGVNHFNEGGFITFFSALQLVVISSLSYKIFQIRSKKRGYSLWRNPSAIWLIIALGFLFLTADELFRIHEKVDSLIHVVFNLQETSLTDRIDDIIIGLYGLVGIGLLVAYREEVKTQTKNYQLFVCGFVLLFTMVTFDVLTNRIDILLLFFEHERAVLLHSWISLAEDSLKIFAEAMFVLGFYTTLQKAKYMREELVDLPDGLISQERTE